MSRVTRHSGVASRADRTPYSKGLANLFWGCSRPSKHTCFSVVALIRYRGEHSPHCCGRTLTVLASDRHTGVRNVASHLEAGHRRPHHTGEEGGHAHSANAWGWIASPGITKRQAAPYNNPDWPPSTSRERTTLRGPSNRAFSHILGHKRPHASQHTSSRSQFRVLGCNSHCAGTSAGAPLSLIKSTRNFAGWVALAFRSTT